MVDFEISLRMSTTPQETVSSFKTLCHNVLYFTNQYNQENSHLLRTDIVKPSSWSICLHLNIDLIKDGGDKSSTEDSWHTAVQIDTM